MCIQSHSPINCQWNTFKHNYIVILVLAILPLALGATAPSEFYWSYPFTVYYIFAIINAEALVVSQNIFLQPSW